MERFVQRIYNDLSRYIPHLVLVPADDVKQEIRIAIHTSEQGKLYRVAHHLVDTLLRDYGYSRKKGKDNFLPFYKDQSFTEDENILLECIDEMYRVENLTAREVSEKLGVQYSPYFQKLMHQCYPKGLGRGGARKGAGNFSKK